MAKPRLNISLDQDLAEFAKVFAAQSTLKRIDL